MVHMSIGPWGSNSEGKPWEYMFKGNKTKITIKHGACIDSLAFRCTTNTGVVTNSPIFGGPGGNKTDEVVISSAEYITLLDMMFGNYNGHSVLSYLIIVTNVSMYGPFGTYRGSNVSFPINNGRIVGLFGRADTYVNSIGFFVEPDVPTPPVPVDPKPKTATVDPKPKPVDPKPKPVVPKIVPTPYNDLRIDPQDGKGGFDFIHTDGLSGFANHSEYMYYLECPCCAYFQGIEWRKRNDARPKQYTSNHGSYLARGYHVHDGMATMRPGYTPLPASNMGVRVIDLISGRTSTPVGPPNYGVRVNCPECAKHMGYSYDEKKYGMVRQGQHCHMSWGFSSSNKRG